MPGNPASASEALLSLIMGAGGKSQGVPSTSIEKTSSEDVLGALFDSVRNSSPNTAGQGNISPSAVSNAEKIRLAKQASFLAAFNESRSGNSNRKSSGNESNGPVEQPKLENEAGERLLAVLTQSQESNPGVITTELDDESSSRIEGNGDQKAADVVAVPAEDQASSSRTLSNDIHVSRGQSGPSKTSAIQAEQPQLASRKPSPFTFFSPFDALDALAAKQRAASSPIPSVDTNTNLPTSAVPSLPKRQASHSHLESKKAPIAPPLPEGPPQGPLQGVPPDQVESTNELTAHTFEDVPFVRMNESSAFRAEDTFPPGRRGSPVVAPQESIDYTSVQLDSAPHKPESSIKGVKKEDPGHGEAEAEVPLADLDNGIVQKKCGSLRSM